MIRKAQFELPDETIKTLTDLISGFGMEITIIPTRHGTHSIEITYERKHVEFINHLEDLMNDIPELTSFFLELFEHFKKEYSMAKFQYYLTSSKKRANTTLQEYFLEQLRSAYKTDKTN